ncbi:MAG: OmpA family protein [Planctomycetota bacterium]
MQTARLAGLIVFCVLAGLIGGCVSADQYGDLRVQNRMQQERITELESQLSADNLQIMQLKEQVNAAEAKGSTMSESLAQEIAALEKALDEKQALITRLRERMVRGGGALPIELTTQLEDFAQNNEMVTFDANSGILKFSSDLVFAPGSDKVSQTAASAVKTLCNIINSEQGRAFDIVIAGHTDDQPIKYSKAKHQTNWHLSVHRAIAVLAVMEENGITPTRLSVRGFGEYRPAAENAPGQKGQEKNRRVEIYIVPAGT